MRIHEEGAMTIRIAAIEVSHWHALHDAAYLRHLIAMPDVKLVAIQSSDAGLVARRAAEVGNPPTFTDYRQMLATTRPDFVVALGRHRQMAGIAHDLLDQGYPFLMEKPMGINASEVEAVAARLDAFVAVPLAQRYRLNENPARVFLPWGRGLGSPWLVRGEYESGLRFNNAWARQKFPRKPTRAARAVSSSTSSSPPRSRIRCCSPSACR